LQYNLTYIYKVRVESVAGQGALYSMKIWEQGQPESANWDSQAYGIHGATAGSILFIAHFTAVTIGNVTVVPITPGAGSPTFVPNGGTFVEEEYEAEGVIIGKIKNLLPTGYRNVLFLGVITGFFAGGITIIIIVCSYLILRKLQTRVRA